MPETLKTVENSTTDLSGVFTKTSKNHRFNHFCSFDQKLQNLSSRISAPVIKLLHSSNPDPGPPDVAFLLKVLKL